MVQVNDQRIPSQSSNEFFLSSIIVHRKQSIPATDAQIDKVRRVCFSSQVRCGDCVDCAESNDSGSVRLVCVLLFANGDHDEKICL